MWTNAVVIVLIHFTVLFNPYLCQRVESVRGPGGEDACNVVNVHFGSDENRPAQDGGSKVGPPGKVGPVGPTGLKGNKGGRGEKGDRGVNVDTGPLKQDIINMINAGSCEELMELHGIEESGYYLMKANPLAAEAPTYRYCDFTPHTDVSSCSELTSKYNASIQGYYRFATLSGSFGFQYCPDPYTCEQLSKRDGTKQSGLYQLGPSGNQFEVYCNFFYGQAVTEIWHDLMDEKQASSTCSTQGCFTVTPSYKVTPANIEKITTSSRECRQYIKMRCHASVLLFGNNPHAWWVSRKGEKILYWGGAVSERPYYCACGETGTCINNANNYKCNCDNNGDVMTQDEGYLTDKTKLPVREMKFGDLNDAGEKAWHTLGKLECTGQD